MKLKLDISLASSGYARNGHSYAPYVAKCTPGDSLLQTGGDTLVSRTALKARRKDPDAAWARHHDQPHEIV